jgi:protein involved in polysaccharide export with SLBB domain
MSHATGQSKTIDLSDTQGLNTLIHPSDVVNLVARPQEFFYVGGEISAPGQKDYHPGMTLTQALLASGGVRSTASGAVRVSRQSADGRLVPATYDLRLIQEGKIPDPALQPGDRIEVEAAGKKK